MPICNLSLWSYFRRGARPCERANLYVCQKILVLSWRLSLAEFNGNASDLKQ